MTAKRIALITLMLAGLPVLAADHVAVKHPSNLPASMDLSYRISAKQRGIPLGGSADIQWRAQGDKYSIHAETRATLLGRILVNDSEGALDANGLTPSRFYEDRFRRDPVTTTFHADNKTITFTNSDKTYPIKGGEQDRTSIIWALVGAARAAPDKFVPGSEWAWFVAGQRDAERWSFKVVEPEVIKAGNGETHTIHLVKAPPADAKGQQLDVWLAPEQDWLPVRLRFSDANGDYVDQTLDKVARR